MILLDTNILGRIAQPTDPMIPVVKAAIDSLRATGEEICIVPQNLYEFWALATRPPKANGLGLSIVDTQSEIARFKLMFRLLPDHPALLTEWEALVGTYACHGKVSFDARLVAAMHALGIPAILTINVKDFIRFSGITILDPRTIGTTP